MHDHDTLPLPARLSEPQRTIDRGARGLGIAMRACGGGAGLAVVVVLAGGGALAAIAAYSIGASLLAVAPLAWEALVGDADNA